MAEQQEQTISITVMEYANYIRTIQKMLDITMIIEGCMKEYNYSADGVLMAIKAICVPKPKEDGNED